MIIRHDLDRSNEAGGEEIIHNMHRRLYGTERCTY
jgi:hypothetical protein